MKGAMDAIGLDGSRLDIVLMQMVNLMRDGKPVRMSKRTGKAITLTDLLDEVPIDSARFFFNQRESSSTLDFDLDLAVRNDSENPVYYVQYAHARICSVLKKLESEGVKFGGADAVDASVLTDPAEQALIRLLAAFPAEIAALKIEISRKPFFSAQVCLPEATSSTSWYRSAPASSSVRSPSATTPALKSIQVFFLAASWLLVAIFSVGAGAPNGVPRPVLNSTMCAPAAVSAVAETRSLPGPYSIFRPLVVTGSP